MTEEIEKLKRRNKILMILVALGVIVLCGAPITCGILSSLDEPLPRPTRTPLPVSSPPPAGPPTVLVATAPVATLVPTPSPIPTPAYFTVARIERERSALTEIQRNQYDQNILGEIIEFQGQVLTVNEDGRVGIDEGGLWTVVGLYGIPREVAITLDEGTLISGMGTIIDCKTFLGLTIEIQVTSWSK